MEPIRLNKYLSAAGICSRREADRLIAGGTVLVDGVPADMGMKVTDENVILVNGELVQPQQEMVILAVYKPEGIVCTTAEHKGEHNIVNLVNYPKRVYPIGRLDKASEGLILMTNYGEIADKILRGSNYHEKEYLVTVNRPVTPEFIREMSHGVPILDTVTRPCTVTKTGKNSFRIILTQGLNRQIRRMCEYFGYRVVTLKRVRIMNLNIDGIEEGEYREITPTERKKLEEMLSSGRSQQETGGRHERSSYQKNERTGGKTPGSVKGVLSGRQGDHAKRGVRCSVRRTERTGRRDRNRSGRQSDR